MRHDITAAGFVDRISEQFPSLTIEVLDRGENLCDAIWLVPENPQGVLDALLLQVEHTRSGYKVSLVEAEGHDPVGGWSSHFWSHDGTAVFDSDVVAAVRLWLRRRRRRLDVDGVTG